MLLNKGRQHKGGGRGQLHLKFNLEELHKPQNTLTY